MIGRSLGDLLNEIGTAVFVLRAWLLVQIPRGEEVNKKTLFGVVSWCTQSNGRLVGEESSQNQHDALIQLKAT